MTELKEMRPMTLEEFEAMEKEEHLRYELLDGAVLMAPSPSFEHQQISGNVVAIAKAKLKGLCITVFEYDLQADGYNVLKPDVSIYCKKEKEIPEIVFEVLSPSTKQRDLMIKPGKYQAAGVKEYWIIDPVSRTVIVHSFLEHTDEINIYTEGNTISSSVHPELTVAVKDIFDEIV
ncbi:MAG: Uma2 family endonuclease [Peptococcaceae bacterium]